MRRVNRGGRPKRYGEKVSAEISGRVTEDEALEFHGIALTMGKTRSEVTRLAIREFMECRRDPSLWMSIDLLDAPAPILIRLRAAQFETVADVICMTERQLRAFLSSEQVVELQRTLQGRGFGLRETSPLPLIAVSPEGETADSSCKEQSGSTERGLSAGQVGQPQGPPQGRGERHDQSCAGAPGGRC